MTRLPELLYGRGAFAPVPHIFEALEPELLGERPGGLPHSLYEELWHLRFWQDFLLARAAGGRPEVPARAADSWPERCAPESDEAWRALVAAVEEGLARAAAQAGESGALERPLGERSSVRGMLESLAVHNAYHFGRMVVLRQLLGSWPPPSGGDSW